MPEEPLENLEPADSQTGEAKLVPVAEAIRYRRRAQQAESQLRELEQKLEGFQSQIQQHGEDLAAVEAQRNEAHTQLMVTETHLAAQRLLSEAGVVDLETTSTLLAKRLDFAKEIDPEALASSVEQLLLDKPFLRQTADPSLPPKTASARPPRAMAAGQLTQAAERATRSGDRRDVAEYLRLKRQAGGAG